MFALLPAFLLAIAGRALSFNVSLASGIVQGNEILDLDFSVPPLATCNSNCSSTQQILNACTSTNDSCFCTDATVSSLLGCQQCMFTALIDANQPMPDPKAGSTPLLAAYALSCSVDVNVTLTAAQTTLSVPPTWDGPAGIFVPTGGLVVTVGIGFFLGLSSILILSNM